MSKKAVIDIGSLKTKVAVFDAAKKAVLQSDSHLTLMGKGITEHGVIGTESIQKLDYALQRIKQDLVAQGISDVTIIGTEALRKAKNVVDVRGLVEKYYPHHKLEVIDQHKEAELFFAAVSREFPDQDIVAVDIGGGSVQLIYGKYDGKTQQSVIRVRHNLTTGTYKLQQQYSPDNDAVTTGLPAAAKHVAEAYKAITDTAPIMIFGSTCMRDFIVASGIPTQKSERSAVHPVRVEKPALQDLLVELAGLAPDQRHHYYPDGGYFMYGADYLLLNLLQAIEQTKPQEIYPTNLNSSYAFI